MKYDVTFVRWRYANADFWGAGFHRQHAAFAKRENRRRRRANVLRSTYRLDDKPRAVVMFRGFQ